MVRVLVGAGLGAVAALIGLAGAPEPETARWDRWYVAGCAALGGVVGAFWQG